MKLDLLIFSENIDDTYEVDTALFDALDSTLTQLVDGYLIRSHERSV